MKLVHNRDYDPHIDRNIQFKIRNRQLYCFLILGAPLVIFSMKKSGLVFKDMITINPTLPTATTISQAQTVLPVNTGNSFLMFIGNLSKKIPTSLKFILRFFFLCLIVIKLFGFNTNLEMFFNLYYLKIYIYTLSSLFIFFELLNLYLVHKFSQQNISISPVLPNFLLKWLSEFKIICKSEKGIQVFKQMCYKQIGLYISILVFIILIS